MSTKTFNLKSGLQFNTPAEVDGYIRGLELARIILNETKTEKAALDKIAGFLDEAHSVKSAGATKPETSEK